MKKMYLVLGFFIFLGIGSVIIFLFTTKVNELLGTNEEDFF